ncbi:uncharacterized protein [Palaemon carinicauda]|uniref:uncharacterized protein n=1 Tax=Palaemon carinicauda TaxID=392227 RepID=UPI0035B5C50D
MIGMSQEEILIEELAASGIDEKHELFKQMASFKKHMLASRNGDRVKKYFYGISKWETFAKTYASMYLPANPVHVALYLSFLLDSGAFYGTISSCMYCIKLAHELYGHVDPKDNKFIKSLVETSKRIAKPPENR